MLDREDEAKCKCTFMLLQRGHVKYSMQADAARLRRPPAGPVHAAVLAEVGVQHAGRLHALRVLEAEAHQLPDLRPSMMNSV